MASVSTAEASPFREVTVVGAGAFGAWAALCLAEAGVPVTLIDMLGIGNERSSSGGESRNFRAAYASNAFYAGLARMAWWRWLERQAQFGTQLLYPCGSLRAGTDKEIVEQEAIFAELGAPFETLSAEEVVFRWPQLAWSADRTFFEPEAGVLAAARTLREVEREFCRLGGEVRRGRARVSPSKGAIGIEVDGRSIDSGTVVLACGPWLSRLLPELLGELIRTPRRELLFFTPSPGDDRYDWQRCPNLVSALGWTSSNLGNGFKVAPPMRGIDMDPDSAVRLSSPLGLYGSQRFVAEHLPGLVGRPVVSAYVSQLENTASEDFIIDRCPGNERVIIAGGGSGHAFKFGPLLGEYIAKMVLEGSNGDYPERFGLAAHRPLRPGEGG